MTPSKWNNESPQLRRPSDAVQGLSKAKRKTLSAAITSADGIDRPGAAKDMIVLLAEKRAKAAIGVS